MTDDRPAADGRAADSLGRVHARFARAVVTLYLVTAGLGVLLLVGALYTDLVHQRELARQTLLLETEVRAQDLGRFLQRLAAELTRLGLRSEVNLLDQDLGPERSLLRLAHERSSVFNAGVAVVGADGRALWSEPQGFLGIDQLYDRANWFQSVLRTRALIIMPVAPERARDSLLYMVSPIVRDGRFEGVLVGGVDLAVGDALVPETHAGVHPDALLVARDGAVIYPARPPAFAAEEGWKTFVRERSTDPFVVERRIDQRDSVIAGAPVQGTEFLLMSLAATGALFGPAQSRLVTRLGLGVSLAVLPVLLLVGLLRRSFRQFQRSEEEALRGEQLRLLGEAASLIAHEVKNSLNGLRLGFDMMVQGRQEALDPRRQQAVAGLRTEIERLSEFTTQLLTLSRGVVPRPVPIDLGPFVRTVTGLLEPAASRLGVRLDVRGPAVPIRVRADPSLVHVVVANLVNNAIEALSVAPPSTPSVAVEVERDGSTATVRVADNGAGVSESVRPRLFEPFVTGKPSGVGIGLALSRRIARAHGGDLVLQPAAAGASFLLTLPAEGS